MPATLDVIVDDHFPAPADAYAYHREPMWLPAGLLATLFLLTMSLSAFGGEADLSWRPARVAKQRSVSSDGSYKLANRQRIDRRVRTVQYQEDRFGSAPRRGLVRKHSIVTERQEIRLAQDDAGRFADELERQFAEPMIEDDSESPDEPQFDPPVIEELPEGQNNATEQGGALPDLFNGDGNIDLPEEDADDEPAFDPFDDSSRNKPRRDRISPSTEPLDPAPNENTQRDSRGSGTRPSRAKPKADNDKLADERTKAKTACAGDMAELRASTLSTLDLTIGVAGIEGEDYPFVCSIDDGTLLAPRCWEPITYTWKASALCHKPLYFEQEALERYGHSWGPFLQPVVSGAHFFSRLPVLPYAMGIKPPTECVYTLGHYRPGSCAPYLIKAVPFTWRAAGFELGAWVGGVFLIP